MLPSTTALIVIDVQNDFCPSGALAVPEGDQVVPVINEMMSDYQTVLLTQDWHPADHSSFASQHGGRSPLDVIEMDYGPQVLWPDHCVQGTEGAEFHSDLNTTAAQMVIRKGFRQQIDSYSAFLENDQKTPTGLFGYLQTRGVDTVVLTGLATDFCVNYSAQDAVRLGFNVALAENACRGIDIDGSVEATLNQLRAMGVTIQS